MHKPWKPCVHPDLVLDAQEPTECAASWRQAGAPSGRLGTGDTAPKPLALTLNRRPLALWGWGALAVPRALPAALVRHHPLLVGAGDGALEVAIHLAGVWGEGTELPLRGPQGLIAAQQANPLMCRQTSWRRKGAENYHLFGKPQLSCDATPHKESRLGGATGNNYHPKNYHLQRDKII